MDAKARESIWSKNIQQEYVRGGRGFSQGSVLRCKESKADQFHVEKVQKIYEVERYDWKTRLPKNVRGD